MDLILLRHAEAEDTFPDAQRKLTQKGKKDSAKIAKWLLERIPKDFELYSSDLIRAKETARFLMKEPVIIEELLPHINPQRLLDKVSWPYDDATVILVGHQPQIGYTAGHILGLNESLKTRKASFWWFKGDTNKEFELFCHIAPASL
jgi:phosphohistidine phosphatase